jgi:hypothetical protein
MHGQWLWLGQQIKANWQIGDNIGYPCRALRIRKVYHLMKDFIIDHFKEKSNLADVLSSRV